ncbi:hypothetical protein B7486_59225 [cyanobacterium TDX16]|nr:hypothetical protein B7486_59225 [cyanobacterium TDX16]
MRSVVLVAAAGTLALVGLSGCSDDSSSSAPSSSGGSCTGETAPTVGGGDAVAFTQQELVVQPGEGDEVTSCVLVADTSDERAQGLMGVTDLGGYDGMLFAFDEPVDGAFHMLDTPMPLSIAWFDESGALVSTDDMAPCVRDESSASPCPSYPAGDEFSFAVEVPLGQLDTIGIDGPDATLVVD